MGALDGKVVIVTGASTRGIGGATARRFAAAGANLFLTSADEQREREAIIAQCREVAESAGAIECRPYDFTRDGAAERMVADALERFGRVDVLVNNAAARERKAFGDFSASDFERLLAVNVRAPFLASQAVLPAMRRQGGGRIIHVASQMGIVSAPQLALYSLTKAALISLTRSMALELVNDGITVNAVSPGPIATAYQDRLSPDTRAAFRGEVPMGRFGDPDEIAEVIYFLATSRGTFIQGHNLVVDGGYVLH